ncbi:MAG: flagellar hook-basal body complex protein FliE [Gammaproteobacteria bacterium]|nr:flagellar hook-basal body complex protein FliE [Gammaproteobacteria bacterium]MBT8151538.1 flagellar hook-basal body complex protein FliE [Gammaproteobacteria bacterium]NND39847.1 flagellar hook-basal body complex protein FliE [Pseudomonadales bacterium]NNM11147.1 flagellar hook-basal body complex protein FliE [Pseudomonadales bacterium]RZV56992.1 MAG: flagellar hook-basal body complex protein FliE [Pseudomonadales bacterium]
MSSSQPINRPDVNQVLNEMRALKSRAQGFEPATAAGDSATGANPVEFQSMLAQAVDKVNSVQKESGDLAEAFQLGDPEVTLSQVVIASEKAGIAFEAMSEVRNRLVKAYEDIMNMPI